MALKWLNKPLDPHDHTYKALSEIWIDLVYTYHYIVNTFLVYVSWKQNPAFIFSLSLYLIKLNNWVPLSLSHCQWASALSSALASERKEWERGIDTTRSLSPSNNLKTKHATREPSPNKTNIGLNFSPSLLLPPWAPKLNRESKIEDWSTMRVSSNHFKDLTYILRRVQYHKQKWK